MKLLLIAYVYPPIGFAGTFRALRMSKKLACMGYDVSILTIKEQPDLYNNHSLLAGVKDTVKIFRTETLDPWRAYQRKKNWVLSLPGGKGVNEICCLGLKLINQPDHMIYWIPFAVQKGLKIIKKDKISAIITTSPPHSEHIIGMLLKKIACVKWIADFRDPIVDNIAFPGLSSWERNVLSRLEKAFVGTADAVVMNTEVAKRKIEARYGATNVHMVRNSFDEDDFTGLEVRKNSRFTVAHVGSIYAFRKTESFFKAVHLLEREKKIFPETFRVLFVGFNDPLVKIQIERFELQEFIEVMDMVSHKEVLELMCSAHLLLLVKGFGDNSAGQIPGKLFEYLGTGNRILCLAPKESEAAQIVTEEQAGRVVADDVEGLARALMAEYRAWRNGEKPSKEQVMQRRLKFASKKMAERMGDIIQGFGCYY